jgi:chromosome segregation ATPase
MADEQMTDEQAISLLSKMDVEQKTLRDLWGQFSGAIQQVGKVVQRYSDIRKELPELEKQRGNLRTEIAALGTALTEKKRMTQEELSKYRTTLEEAIAPLEKEVREWREKAISMQGTVKDIERQGQVRREQIEEEIQKKETELFNKNKALADFHKKIGVETA